MQMPSLYHSLWERIFQRKWVLGLFLIFLFGIPRFILVLKASVTGQNQWVSIIFTIMMFTPLIFLRKAGREALGIRKSTRPLWLLWGFLLGCGMCLFLFALTRLIYGLEISNPFVYIASVTTTGDTSMLYFLIYLAVMMTFSPIGEELFYRGVVHQAFKAELGDKKAAVIDSAAFALTHLAHFGIVYLAGTWKLFPLPALIWISAMFLTCLVFNRVRQESGSILGAILTHAGFNFAMGFLIFYAL
jgi:membrane protease YdiL (CAAX protease family)